jgi:hypothetical protein
VKGASHLSGSWETLQSRPRASPSVSRNQVNLSNLKRLAINKEPVSSGKQPSVAEPVQKSKPQVITFVHSLIVLS